MMDISPTNNKAHVHFGGAEDNSMRSAWRTTDRSVLPPCQAQRKATIGSESLEQAMADAALVAALDADSDEESLSSEKDPAKDSPKDSPKVLGIIKPPSCLKARAKTVPILKTSSHLPQNQDYTIKRFPPLADHRSAWDNNETRHSFTSIMGPTPVQRQGTMDETELMSLCAKAAAASRDSSSSFRESASRNPSIQETHEEQTSQDLLC